VAEAVKRPASVPTHAVPAAVLVGTGERRGKREGRKDRRGEAEKAGKGVREDKNGEKESGKGKNKIPGDGGKGAGRRDKKEEEGGSEGGGEEQKYEESALRTKSPRPPYMETIAEIEDPLHPSHTPAFIETIA
jgi:hypothetical protein